MESVLTTESLDKHIPNKLLSPERFAHHELLLFYPFRSEKEMSSSFPTNSVSKKNMNE